MSGLPPPSSDRTAWSGPPRPSPSVTNVDQYAADATKAGTCGASGARVISGPGMPGRTSAFHRSGLVPWHYSPGERLLDAVRTGDPEPAAVTSPEHGSIATGLAAAVGDGSAAGAEQLADDVGGDRAEDQTPGVIRPNTFGQCEEARQAPGYRSNKPYRVLQARMRSSAMASRAKEADTDINDQVTAHHAHSHFLRL